MKTVLCLLALSGFAFGQTTEQSQTTKTTKTTTHTASSSATKHAMHKHSAMTASSTMVAMTGDEMKWMDAPSGLPAGEQIAVIKGDPTKPGPYIIRLKSPAGAKIAPHWHPTAENITILSGDFTAGTGDSYDEGAMKTFGPGSFITMPAHMHHYAGSKGDSVIQIEGMGPFKIFYVNPSDDPRKAGAPSEDTAKPNTKTMRKRSKTAASTPKG